MLLHRYSSIDTCSTTTRKDKGSWLRSCTRHRSSWTFWVGPSLSCRRLWKHSCTGWKRWWWLRIGPAFSEAERRKTLRWKATCCGFLHWSSWGCKELNKSDWWQPTFTLSLKCHLDRSRVLDWRTHRLILRQHCSRLFYWQLGKLGDIASWPAVAESLATSK